MLPADQLTATLLDYIVEDMGLAAGARVALLVSGLGATPQMELDVVMRAAYDKLAARGSPSSGPGRARCCRRWTCRAARCRCCAWTTAGWRCWTRPRARAWPGGGRVNQDIHVAAPAMEQERGPGRARRRRPALDRRPEAGAGRGGGGAARKEPTLTELDSLAGDGDLGASMKRAADAILAVPDAALADPTGALAALGGALRKAIAGSSGPFYATALLRASRRLARGAQPSRATGPARSAMLCRPSATWAEPRPATGPCWMRCSRPPPPSSRAWRGATPAVAFAAAVGPRSRARRRPPPWRRAPRQLPGRARGRCAGRRRRRRGLLAGGAAPACRVRVNSGSV